MIIITGWQAKTLENEIRSQYQGPAELLFVYNRDYNLQNGLSVLSTAQAVVVALLLTMADHILDDDIMKLVSNHQPPEGGATLCVDYKLDTIFDIDDATKVLAKDSFIKQIGKNLPKYNCIDTGVFIGTDGLMGAIDRVYKQKGDASLSEGVQFLADRGLMEILDIQDAFWQDVDNLDMLVHAEKLLREKSERLHSYQPN